MKKYNITVNGNTYEVEVDEIGGTPNNATSFASVPAADPVSTPPAAAPASVSAASSASSAPSAGAVVVDAPMPGVILEVLKSVGDAVDENETVLILEAMKMENEIVAPKAGTIDAIMVSKGASAGSGDALFSVK